MIAAIAPSFMGLTYSSEIARQLYLIICGGICVHSTLWVPSLCCKYFPNNL